MITYKWLKHNGYSNSDLFLYNVKYGQPYEQIEIEAIKKLKKFYGFEIKQFEVNLLDETNSPDIFDPTIPARNLLMAYFGIFNSNTIAISSPFGEYSPIHNKQAYQKKSKNCFKKVLDKNPIAFDKMSETLSLLTDKKIKVRSFIDHKTKTEWLVWLKNEYPDEVEFILRTTVSCHDKNNYCGKCQPCLWKWCSMINNNIPIKSYWKNGIDFESYSIQEAIINLKELKDSIKETDIYYDHFIARWEEVKIPLEIMYQIKK